MSNCLKGCFCDKCIVLQPKDSDQNQLEEARRILTSLADQPTGKAGSMEVQVLISHARRFFKRFP